MQPASALAKVEGHCECLSHPVCNHQASLPAISAAEPSCLSGLVSSHHHYNPQEAISSQQQLSEQFSSSQLIKGVSITKESANLSAAMTARQLYVCLI